MAPLQVGEYETVLEVGSALLEAREARPFRRDIMLSMALAHCGLASAAFDEQAVAAGCGHLKPCATETWGCALSPSPPNLGMAFNSASLYEQAVAVGCGRPAAEPWNVPSALDPGMGGRRGGWWLHYRN